MAFDPSVLSDISGPDPIGSKERAYKLKDLIDSQQLDSLKLYQAKQEQSDMEKAKKILAKGDISTPEGMMSAASDLSKAGLPQQAMGLMKEAGSARQQSMQLDETKLRLLQMSSDVIGPAALQIKQTLQTQGLPMAQAQYSQQIMQILPMIPQQFRQHLPTQLPNDPQKAMQMLDEAVAKSQQARQIIAQQTAAKKEARAEETQTFAEQREARQEAEEKRKEAKESDRRKEQETGLISDASAQLAVDRILNGEQARDVLANFGRGKQGPTNIAKVQNLLASTAKDRGISAQEITARNVELSGLKKEEQTEAGIAGRISYAEKEIQQIAPKVLEISAKVPRGSFVPFNKLRNYTAAQLSDPNLKQLKAYLTTLTNSYDVLGGRGGTDVEKRAHNRELLDAADSPEALKAAVDAITQEAALSHTAAGESMKVDRGALGGAAKDNDPLGLR